MKHKVLQPIQKEWIGWLLDEGKHFLKGKGDELNHQLLNWSWVNGVYDIRTEQLLNHLLKEFNKDEGIKRKWHLKKEWDKANVI